MKKNTICLWYDHDVEQAARLYARTFPDSVVGVVHRAPSDFPSGKAGEVMLALSCDSRNAVNTVADAAGKSGGVADCNPPQDHGFMFSRSVEDPDGHVWEAMWMDPKGMPAN